MRRHADCKYRQWRICRLLKEAERSLVVLPNPTPDHILLLERVGWHIEQRRPPATRTAGRRPILAAEPGLVAPRALEAASSAVELELVEPGALGEVVDVGRDDSRRFIWDWTTRALRIDLQQYSNKVAVEPIDLFLADLEDGLSHHAVASERVGSRQLINRRNAISGRRARAKQHEGAWCGPEQPERVGRARSQPAVELLCPWRRRPCQHVAHELDHRLALALDEPAGREVGSAPVAAHILRIDSCVLARLAALQQVEGDLAPPAAHCTGWGGAGTLALLHRLILGCTVAVASRPRGCGRHGLGQPCGRQREQLHAAGRRERPVGVTEQR
eukprot:424197-Prymnesium_polylepis.2